MAGCLSSTVGRVLVAGSGFLADAYDIYIISMVQTVLGRQFPELPKGEKKDLESTIATAALAGAMVGQLCFGFLADRLGRRVIFVTTGALIVCGSLLPAMAPADLGARQTYQWIAFWRLVLGFGIGGEYPLSATIAAESSSARERGTLMACVFSMQGVGYLLSTLLMLATVSAGASYDFTWRFGLGMGALLPAASLYFRWRLHESDAFRHVSALRSGGDERARQRTAVWRYRWHVLGTALNWFLFDICFYANSLFNQDITSEVLKGDGGLTSQMQHTLIIVLMQLPGYLASILFINKLGRKRMQLLGFAAMLAFFLVCAYAYDWFLQHSHPLFLLCFGLTFFFSNFGPNTSTFVIPGEIYPAQIKGTCHGLSAASGKLGATLGTFALGRLKGEAHFISTAMLCCAACCVLGLATTTFFTPSYEPEQLEAAQSGETVGFVPLPFQARKSRRLLAVSEQQQFAASEVEDNVAAAASTGRENV